MSAPTKNPALSPRACLDTSTLSSCSAFFANMSAEYSWYNTSKKLEDDDPPPQSAPRASP